MRVAFYHVLTLLPLVAGCHGVGSVNEYTIEGDRPADYEAGDMASRLSPVAAAVVLADWMESAPVDRQNYTVRLYEALRDSLNARDIKSGDMLDRAIDSVYAVRPVECQAKILVMSASPERVAAALNSDSVPEVLIQQVGSLYKTHPDLFSRFQSAIVLNHK